LSVRFVDRDEVVVHAPAGGASFTSGDARLLVQSSGASDTFTIEIPRNAPRVEIRVQERTVFLKDRDRVSTSGSADPAGIYRIAP
jgi:hypothetical protein